MTGRVRHPAGSACPFDVEPIPPLRLAASPLGLCLAGCFTQPPSAEDTDTDAADDAMSSTAAPASTDEGSGTTAGSADATAGSGEDDGGSETGCDAAAGRCADPGATIWSVVLGGDGNDGAYAIASDGSDTVVVGEQGEGGAAAAWTARLDADGEVVWSLASGASEGDHALRGVAPTGDGNVVAVGADQLGASTIAANLEVRDLDGASIYDDAYTYSDANFLLAALIDPQGGFFTVGYTTTGPRMISPLPMMLHHVGNASDGWTLGDSTADTGTLATLEGRFFDVAFSPSGELVVVGSLVNGASPDAALLLLAPSGELLDGPYLIGQQNGDGFVGVHVAEDGSGVAVGSDGTGDTTSQALIVRFTVGGTIMVGAQTTWGEAPFTNVNGFARDGDALFIAAGTADDVTSPQSFESLIFRWDGEADAPTWAVPWEDDAPGRDFASDVALADDDTIVVCGVMTPEGTDNGDAWVKKLAR